MGIRYVQRTMEHNRTAVILQSSYLPWRGVLDLANIADTFVLFDHAQYTRNDWRNRNKIMSPNGPFWLTIPVKRRFGETIDQAEVDGSQWTKKHFRAIQQNYSKEQGYRRIKNDIEDIYNSAANLDRLSSINRIFIDFLVKNLDISVEFISSRDILRRVGVESTDSPQTDEDPVAKRYRRNHQLIEMCHAVSATRYVSGPAALTYLDEAQFLEAGITLRVADFTGYPRYRQLSEDYHEKVSALDLLLMTERDALNYLLSTHPGHNFLKTVRDHPAKVSSGAASFEPLKD